MSTEWLAVVTAFVSGFIPGYFAWRSSVKVANISKDVDLRKIEAQAYERAKGLYESGISQLEEQLARMREQMADEQNISNTLRRQVNELEATVGWLRAELIRAGIDLPDNPAGLANNSHIAHK